MTIIIEKQITENIRCRILTRYRKEEKLAAQEERRAAKHAVPCEDDASECSCREDNESSTYSCGEVPREDEEPACSEDDKVLCDGAVSQRSHVEVTPVSWQEKLNGECSLTLYHPWLIDPRFRVPLQGSQEG